MSKSRWNLGLLGAVLLLGLGMVARLGADQASGPEKPAQKPEEAPLRGGIPFPTEPPAPNEGNVHVYADGKGRVYRLWIQERGEKGRGGIVRFSRSDDGGLTWLKEPLTILDSGEKGQAIDPQLAFDGNGNLFATWRTKFQRPNYRHVRFQQSSDFGATWAAESRTLNHEAAGFEPQIGLGPRGHLYAAWSDERFSAKPKVFDIYFVRSTDQGKTWEGEVRLTARPGEATAPAGALNFRPRLVNDAAGRVYLTWIGISNAGSAVFFRRSLDFGKSWEETVNVSQGGSSTGNQTLLQGGDDRLFLFWQTIQGGPLSVYFSRSEDGGKTWAAPVQISRPRARGLGQSAFPEAARGPKGELYVVWQDNRNGREDIYLNRSLDGGKSWLGEDLRLDQDDPGTAISRVPRIAVSDAGTVAVAWEDDRKGFAGIYLAVSFDGGKRWRETRVDQDTPERADARVVQLAWGPNEVLHLVWETRKQLSASDLERSVRYRRLAIRSAPGS